MVAEQRSRRLTTLYIVAFIAALAALSLFFLGPREPAYEGQSLSAWLDEYTRYIKAQDQTSQDKPKRDRAQAAIQ